MDLHGLRYGIQLSGRFEWGRSECEPSTSTLRLALSALSVYNVICLFISVILQICKAVVYSSSVVIEIGEQASSIGGDNQSFGTSEYAEAAFETIWLRSHPFLLQTPLNATPV
jgi:hypothetical protein